MNEKYLDVKERLYAYTTVQLSERQQELLIPAIIHAADVDDDEDEVDIGSGLINLAIDDIYDYSGYENLESHGGEGEGERAWGVFKLDDVIFRFDFEYYSYNGYSAENGNLRVVTAQERTITVYE